ncbi:hypothetical protein [Herbiconiux liukaitaii]|uniref:hypothetical protein n=1 Tax=Herbiconiux liukaitaii TaxID=3342799 RepID=UPI0035B7CCA8
MTDWQQFVAALISALAWPVAVTTLLLVFRSQVVAVVKGLLSRIDDLSELKIGNNAATFKRQAAEAGASVAQLNEATGAGHGDGGAGGLPSATKSENEERAQRVATLAEVAPREAVIESYIDVERAVSRWLMAKGFQYKGSPTAALRRNNEIPVTVRRSLSVISDLRNRAAHSADFSITSSAAIEYANASDELIRYFETDLERSN